MDTNKLASLLIGSRCCLSSLSEAITGSLAILKNLWRDEKTCLMLSKATSLLNTAKTQKACIGTCEKCRETLLALHQCLETVGLENIFVELLLARLHAKTNSENKKGEKYATDKTLLTS